jgi:rRNA maturation RNase YbeY
VVSDEGRRDESKESRRDESKRDVEVVISDTETAQALGAELIDVCERAARTALRLEEAHAADLPVEVGLTLTDDPGIQELNRRYLDRDRPTDVMAFGLGDDGDLPVTGVLLLGDVVISVEMARRQAEEYERPFAEELARLVAHGTLHLLGYTDDDDEPAVIMRSREDSVLTALGFAPEEPPGRSGPDDETLRA